MARVIGDTGRKSAPLWETIRLSLIAELLKINGVLGLISETETFFRPGSTEEKPYVLMIVPAVDCTKLFNKLNVTAARLHNADHRSTESEHSIVRSEKPSKNLIFVFALWAESSKG